MKRALLLAAMFACSKPAPAPAPVAPPPPPAPAAAAHGRLETKHVASASLGVTKDVVVWLPAGYDAAPDKHWPVYYYLHGLGGDETSWTKWGKLDEVADKLGVQAIIVMPDADNSFYTDAVTPVDYAACMADGKGLFIPTQPHAQTCVKTPAYESWIVKDVVSWADATYRTIPAKEARALAGFSMGGFGALELGLRHKDMFAAAVSHSGVDALLYKGPNPYVAGKVELFDKVVPVPDPLIQWLTSIFGPDIANWRAHDPATLAADLQPGELAIYLDCGTEDMFHLQNGEQYLHDLLTSKHIDHAFFIGPGAHDFTFWGPRMPSSFAFLKAHVAGPK